MARSKGQVEEFGAAETVEKARRRDERIVEARIVGNVVMPVAVVRL